MVERAIIRLEEPPKQINEEPMTEGDPTLEISWFGMHPGDKVESRILNHILNHAKLDHTKEFSHFISQDCVLVFIRWYSSKLGVALTHDLLGLNGVNMVSTVDWLNHVWYFHFTESLVWDEFFPKYLEPDVELTVSPPTHCITVDMFQQSLEGKRISIQANDKNIAIETLTDIIDHFPWTVTLLKTGSWDTDSIDFNYMGTQLNIHIDYSEIFQQILDQKNQLFWSIIRKGLILSASLSEEPRFHRIRESILIAFLVSRVDQEPTKKLENIKAYTPQLLELDVDFTINYVSTALNEASMLEPTIIIARLLLDVASQIIELNFADLAKLAEGTALQVAFMLASVSDREKIIMEVTARSKIWGSTHLVGFIQSITGILAETLENRRILAKVVESTTEILRESWDGVLCLVNTYIIAGEVMKAVELRINATDLIADKFSRAEDVVSAIIWSLEYDNIDEEHFISLMRPKFEQSIDDLPIGEIFHHQIERIIDSCLEHRRITILTELINWFKINFVRIPIDNRIPLIETLESKLIPTNLFELQIEIKILKFSYYLTQDEIDQLGDAESQLRSIFNLLDPNKENFRELITNISRSLILVSAKTQMWVLIEETRKRFKLLLKDEDYTDEVILQCYLEGGKDRSSTSRSELNRNDIGLKLFDEAIILANRLKSAELVYEFIGFAKKLAMKVNAYQSFANYANTETTIAHSLNKDWLSLGIISATELLNKGALEGAKMIFSTMQSFDSTMEQQYEIINAMLELVEIDPDFLTSDEISLYRRKLIDISTSEESEFNTDEVVTHYRDGIAVLMAKGDRDQLNKFILEALKYSHTQKLTSVDEFSSLSLDSFSADLATYSNTGNFRIYRELMKISRMITDTFLNTHLSLPMKFTNLLITANLDLYASSGKHEFIRRAQLLAMEISYSIKLARLNDVPIDILENEKLMDNYDEITELLIASDSVFGNITAVTNSGIFYRDLGKLDSLYKLLDQVLMDVKKESIKMKDINSLVIVGIMTLCESFIATDAEFEDVPLKEIQDRGVGLLNTILTMPRQGSKKKTIIRLTKLLDQIESTPRQAFQEFPFSIEEYLKEIDYNL